MQYQNLDARILTARLYIRIQITGRKIYTPSKTHRASRAVSISPLLDVAGYRIQMDPRKPLPPAWVTCVGTGRPTCRKRRRALKLQKRNARLRIEDFRRPAYRYIASGRLAGSIWLRSALLFVINLAVISIRRRCPLPPRHPPQCDPIKRRFYILYTLIFSHSARGLGQGNEARRIFRGLVRITVGCIVDGVWPVAIENSISQIATTPRLGPRHGRNV